MKFTFSFITLLAFLSVAFSSLAAPQADIPSTDISGASDSAVVGRFRGSVIVAYEKFDYDEVTLPLSALIKSEPRVDAESNNRLYKPANTKAVAGKHTRIVYVAPEGVTALQAMRNYQNDAKAKGGQVLYECDSSSCGGDNALAFFGGGGNQGMAKYLWSAKKITAKYDSLPHCAQSARLSDLRYTAIEIPKSHAHLSLLAYQIADNHCTHLIGRTVVVAQIIETEAMAQTMAAPKASEMASAIKSEGRIALYGIYFDAGKAEVKTDSAATLAQIGKLMKEQPALKLLVVGHTDSDGNFESNLQLSDVRAKSVVKELVAKYGVSSARLRAVGVAYASPVASNDSNAGKEKNRRVELVADK
jgi:OmpA-OmpF porin, OOP family